MPTTWLGLNQISFKLITTPHTYIKAKQSNGKGKCVVKTCLFLFGQKN